MVVEMCEKLLRYYIRASKCIVMHVSLCGTLTTTKPQIVPHRRPVGTGGVAYHWKMAYKPTAATDRKARVVFDADDIRFQTHQIFFLDAQCTECGSMQHEVHFSRYTAR